MTDSNISLKDRDILRRLGAELAEAAADPVNDTRREVHRRIDRMEPGRPSIMIFQEPWNELNVGGELDVRCEDDFLRGIERGLRMTLYKWRHYPGGKKLCGLVLQCPRVHPIARLAQGPHPPEVYRMN